MEKQTNNQSTKEDKRTSNGMKTNSTSLKNCVDLFFQIGASREWSESEIVSAFTKAYSEDPLTAMRILFYNRDVLQGQGERRTFRIIIKHLAQNYTNSARKNLHLISEFGRWDDLLMFVGTELEKEAFELIKKALIDGENKLAGKWMPREKSKTYKGVANKLRKHMGLNAKDYRKLLVNLTTVVEQQMCSKDWSNIKYSAVPSIAMKNYRTAFYKNDEEGIKTYIEKLEKGEEKISAKAIFPHDIVKPLISGWDNAQAESDSEIKLLEEQWKALPNFMEESTENIIPVCDVSGSMYGLPMEVCIALGLYISERTEGAFKDTFITFSSTPKIQQIKSKRLSEKVNELKRADWDTSTNLEATFRLILDKAVKFNVPQEQLPSTMLILSDMQFNECTKEPNDSAYEMIENQYKEAGYKMPKIVFWNLSAGVGNHPVRFNEKGTAMVSGFSPSILKALLAGGTFTPEGIMFEVIEKERYGVITV